jgi:CRP-like cAMP-binding protein
MTTASQDQVARFIEETEAFRGLPPDVRAGLVSRAGLLTVSPDETIFQRGETGDSLFFVLSGEVRITLQLPKGDQEVSLLKAGDFFGEIALMTHSRRTATVTAVVESMVMELQAADVMPLIENYPEFKACIARTGAQRSRESLEKMIEESD